MGDWVTTLNIVSDIVGIVSFLLTLSIMAARWGRRQRASQPQSTPIPSVSQAWPVAPRVVVRSRRSKLVAITAQLLLLLVCVPFGLMTTYLVIISFGRFQQDVAESGVLLTLLGFALIGAFAGTFAYGAFRSVVLTVRFVGADFVYDPDYNADGDYDPRKK